MFIYQIIFLNVICALPGLVILCTLRYLSVRMKLAMMRMNCQHMIFIKQQVSDHIADIRCDRPEHYCAVGEQKQIYYCLFHFLPVSGNHRIMILSIYEQKQVLVQVLLKKIIPPNSRIGYFFWRLISRILIALPSFSVANQHISKSAH